MPFKKTATGRFLLITVVAASCYGLTPKEVKNTESNTNGEVIAVVELFTSEGCSSCPPADRLIQKIANEKGAASVLLLSYHVDYWDYIGWKDPFSQPQFTQRQRAYARYLSVESIYTPQVVVNGTEEFVGSDETKLRASFVNKPFLAGLAIKATRTSPVLLQVSYTLPEGEGLMLSIALARKNVSTNVKRGENSGKTLQHTNVVVQLLTTEASSGPGIANLNFPAGFRENDFTIIAFTQQRKDYRITGAAQMPVPNL